MDPNEHIAASIAYAAHDLSHIVDKKKCPDAFSMYSYNRFTYRIIKGIALQMLEQGSSEEHVKDVLASKYIRWMLDKEEEALTEFGKRLAEKHDLANCKVSF